MVFPVTLSGAPLEFDTLPALKTRYFSHGSDDASRNAAEVYTMARLYVLRDTLHLSLAAFERDPAPGSRLLFALGGQAEAADAPYALVALAPGFARLQLPARRPMALGEAEALPARELPCERFGGVDEQGWHWGARLQLPQSLADEAGCRFAQGAGFGGLLLKHSTGQPAAFGASHPVPDADRPLDPAAFGSFEVVTY